MEAEELAAGPRMELRNRRDARADFFSKDRPHSHTKRKMLQANLQAKKNCSNFFS